MNFIEYFIVLLPISCFLWLCQAGAGKPDKRMFQLCEARAVRAVFGRFLGGFWAAPFEDPISEAKSGYSAEELARNTGYVP